VKTFVVRIAPVETGATDGQLRGVVDEISSGRRTPFRTTAELISLLSALNRVGGQPNATDRADRPEQATKATLRQTEGPAITLTQMTTRLQRCATDTNGW
jgi:hypothetical protein